MAAHWSYIVSAQKFRFLMYALLIIGVVMALAGLGLAVFTDIATSKGITGVIIIVGLIAGGLLLSVPAKLYLTYQLMRMNDEKLMKS